MKSKNKNLHKLFYKEKVKCLHSVLESYNVIEFIQVPKCLRNIKITNGRFVWFDGNGKCFIGESNNAYYVANWYGS